MPKGTSDQWKLINSYFEELKDNPVYEFLEDNALVSFFGALFVAFLSVNFFFLACFWMYSLRTPPHSRWVIPTDAQEHTVESEDKVQLVGWSKGKGKDIVLIHGLGSSSSSFAFLFKRLSNRGFRVITFDIRGHGESGRTKNFTAAGLASDLALILEKMDCREATLVGYDVGGYVIQALCKYHRAVVATRVARVAFLASFSRVPIAGTAQWYIFLICSGFPHIMCWYKRLAGWFSRPLFGRVTNGTMQEEWRRAFLQCPPRLWKQTVDAAQEDLTECLKDIRVPCLIVCGDADVFSRDLQNKLHRNLVNAPPVRWLQGMGHILLWEGPDRLTALLSEFAETPQASGS